MSFPESRYHWEWRLDVSPEQLWPLVSDTNRFNMDVGLEALDINEPLANKPGKRLRFLQFGFIPIEWEEEPFEWIFPNRFGVLRKYTKGPIKQMRVLVELNPMPEGGTHLIYHTHIQPKNLLGLLAIPFQVGIISARSFDKAFRQYESLLIEDIQPIDQNSSVKLAPAGLSRVQKIIERLSAVGMSENLLEKLLKLVTSADDLSASALRPFVLADHWDLPRRDVLELFLQATRAGLLDYQWELLCPLCRGSGNNTSDSLRALSSSVHCDSCNIDYTANFEQSVEITFRPNPSVRPVKDVEFCVGGPQVTPHIVAQQLLQPGEKRELMLGLEKGRYRLRTLNKPGGQFIYIGRLGLSEVTIQVKDEVWPQEEISLANELALTLENQRDVEQLFILERMAWSDQAVTAAEVSLMQSFRDLFATEALRPGEQFSVGNIAILFTDLVDSTRLYNEIGDAPAFGLVMGHFDVLKKAINDEEGAIVKTIGDAVMAVFRRPVGALKAISAAQFRLNNPPEGQRPLLLKAALHFGPCIAVTLNERLDYFGSTVNMAARLEGFSTAGTIVMSDEAYRDPEIGTWLQENKARLTATSFSAALKGFDHDSFKLWRITPKETEKILEGKTAVTPDQITS